MPKLTSKLICMVSAVVTAIALLAASEAKAQCVNNMQPSCGVYATCFAKSCNCKDSPVEYFLSYGEKYCKTFLASGALSPKGKLWRDATLRCLQEKIVPLLPGEGKACDCGKMQIEAFDQHVACYTQPGNSVCELPASDWWTISSLADGIKNLKDQKGRKQMLEVARICATKTADDTKKAVEDVIRKLLQP